jgi:hypothetical protein
VESRRLQFYSPRLCQLWTDGLVPARCYGPGKPSSLSSIEDGFTPTASMASLGKKLGPNPQMGQLSCCGLCRESFFLGTVALSVVVDYGAKGCYMWTM